MLTTHLITKNNEQTIRRALKTLAPLQCQILVGDFGSTDKTLDICREFDCELYSLEGVKDYSTARNLLIGKSSNDWQFYIEPWEGVIGGYKDLQSPSGDMRFATIVQEEVATKSIRLFNKKCGSRFIRPYYESIDPEVNPQHSSIVIGSETMSDFNCMEILTNWKLSEPTASEPDYYMACMYLAHRHYDQFLKLAEHYLFKETMPTMPVIMTRYYVALVQCHIKKNGEAALKHILKCLMVKPLMAEFWCALGDIYFYNRREVAHAVTFYENAIIMGSKRPKTDTWPVEMKKYNEYPEMMIANINKAIKEQAASIARG